MISKMEKVYHKNGGSDVLTMKESNDRHTECKQDKYLLNTNSKKVHLSASTDGRCRIKTLREEYKIYFSTLEEALNYPTPANPLAKRCHFV